MSKEQHHKIEWFNKLKLNSWEVEILIVGFVLVMLLQIPDYLSFEIHKYYSAISLPKDSPLLNFLVYTFRLVGLYVLYTCVKILIFSFSLYLGFRGFWVGVLGLSSVFPDGINIKNLNFNKIFIKQIEKYNFNNFVVKIDNICSSIFSLSFLLSFSIISLCIFFLEIFVVGIIADKLEPYISFIPFVTILPFILIGLLFFIDYFLFGVIKKIKWRPFGYVFNIIDKFYRYVTLIFIYDTLYYAFISNIKIKRRFILIFAIIFCYYISIEDQLSLEEYTYFPEFKSSTKLMKFSYYENKFKERSEFHEGLYPNHPFINSDVIIEDYLKLYIPYYPIHNRPLESICPEIEGIFSSEDTSQTHQIEKQDNMLDCINKVYSISIDKNKIKNDFVFYNYSHLLLDIKTFFMIIPIDKYINGRHVIHINKTVSDKFTGIVSSGRKTNVEYSQGADSTLIIPFYIQR